MATIKKYGAKAIEESRLEPIPFPHKDPRTLIYFTCPEGTNLCPRSGFPDFWTAHIWYVPKDFIVELKSLKLYINSYRDRAAFHEEMAHLLFHDLKNSLQPSYLKIVLDYTRRGNIQTDVAVEYAEPDFSGPRAPDWKIRYDLR